MKRLFRSLRHAGGGIVYTFRHERNFQVELVMAFLVGVLMLWLPVSAGEQTVLSLAIVLVLALELINTAVERVMDILKPRVHPYARVVKDVMAGSVFVASFGALILGVLILLPYFLPK